MNYVSFTALQMQLGVQKEEMTSVSKACVSDGHQSFSLNVSNNIFLNKILNSAHTNNKFLQK